MNKKDFFCNSFHIIYTNMSNEVVIFFFGVLIINIGYQLMTRKDKKMEWKERPHRNENVNDDAERQDNDKQGRPGRHSPGKCTTQKYIWNRQIQYTHLTLSPRVHPAKNESYKQKKRWHCHLGLTQEILCHEHNLYFRIISFHFSFHNFYYSNFRIPVFLLFLLFCSFSSRFAKDFRDHQPDRSRATN